MFSEQYAHNWQRTKYHSLRGHHQKYFLTYPGRTRANLPLALEKKPRTVVCGQLSNPFSQFFFVKSPPIFSPTLDGVTPNPSLNLHPLSYKEGGHRMPPSCSPVVEGGLGLSAWPFFPLYLRQQLEEDNIFSSLHTRIDRASSSWFFFSFFFSFLRFFLFFLI